jgi:colanic acid/amylovoran biosynthesis glycosyltransferase
MTTPVAVAYIFERYPTLTQTFLQREIAALSDAGLRIEVYAMFGSHFRWWEAGSLVVALPRELWRDPSLARDAWRLLRRHRFTNAENFFSTLWAVVFALCRAQRLRERKPDIIHGVWATGPATTAAILSRCCGIPFSFGAHAYDIYRHSGDAFLPAKLRAARFVHTEIEANVAYLREKAAGASVNIVICRRGLMKLPVCRAKNREPGPIRILSVARLVPKKGHAHQLAACAVLREWGIPFELRIVGDGPLRRQLETGIDSVTLCGARSEEEVEAAYRWADIFWHTGVVAADGDRDGLPNVVPEAMAHELPVICGRAPGVREAVENEVTGLVVDVTNTAELAGAAKRLAGDEPLRRRLGQNGRRWVEKNFVMADNIAPLAVAFREACAAGSRAATDA